MKALWQRIKAWILPTPYTEYTFVDCGLNPSLLVTAVLPWDLRVLATEIANAHPDHPPVRFDLPRICKYPFLLTPLGTELSPQTGRCVPAEKAIVVVDWALSRPLLVHHLKHWLYGVYTTHPDWLFKGEPCAQGDLHEW